jgi:hypothetical protein
MVRSISIVLVAFVLLLTLPLCLGIGGGLIGLTFGLLGGIIGILFGLFGVILGGIAWIFKAVFHLLFGWHLGHGFHSFHFNGYVFIAIVLLILLIASKNRK